MSEPNDPPDPTDTPTVIADDDQPVQLTVASADSSPTDSATTLGEVTAIANAGHGSRYDDLGEIGRGGMGVVSCHVDKVLLRKVATKSLTRSTATGTSSQRFVEEAQITGQLEHPNIVPVYDFGTSGDGEPFFTMKLVGGQTLSRLITELHAEALESMKLAQLIRAMLKICEAISFAHSRGVIHCDLKPENIMVGSFGQVYVMDWGLARLTETKRPSGADEVSTSAARRRRGGVSGTVAYMAPEQARGTGPIDERTDVFALGAILYQLLTGWAPYMTGSYDESLALAQERTLTPPQEACGHPLPPRLCEITMQAMAADPAERHRSVARLHRELEEFLRGGGWFETRTYGPGETIIRQGETADEAYVVASGRCQVYQMQGDDKLAIRELGPGDVFGETAILSSSPRSATVEAIDDVTVKLVTPESFQRELGQDSWVGALVKQLAQRFLELEERVRPGGD